MLQRPLSDLNSCLILRLILKHETTETWCEVIYEMVHILNCGLEIKWAMIIAVETWCWGAFCTFNRGDIFSERVSNALRSILEMCIKAEEKIMERTGKPHFRRGRRYIYVSFLLYFALLCFVFVWSFFFFWDGISKARAQWGIGES